MAFPIHFYSFSKKLNSTKRPGVSERIWQCEIKKSCGIIHPQIILSGTNVEPEQNYNYCYIPIWNRYYYISNWRFEQGLWTASLDVDVLATWKPYIGNTTAYVIRSNTRSTKSIPDPYYNGISGVEYSNVESVQLYSTVGTYVIGVIGNNSTTAAGQGGIKYYALDDAAFQALINTLTSVDFDGYKDISEQERKTAVQPVQFITSCRWYPMSLFGETPRSTIKIGWYNVNITAGRVRDVLAGYSTNATVLLYAHPQADTHGNYLNGSPWTTIYLRLPGLGLVNIPGEIATNTGNLDINFILDPPSGKAIYYIAPRLSTAVSLNGPQAISLPCDFGADIPITQVTSRARGGLFSAVLSGAMTAATKGEIHGGFLKNNTLSKISETAGASLLDNTLNPENTDSTVWDTVAEPLQLLGRTVFGNMVSQPAGLTVQDAVYFYILSPNIYAYQAYKRVENRNTIIGWPLYEMRKISTLSGYIKCDDAKCECPATSSELVQISNFLNGGFFYE